MRIVAYDTTAGFLSTVWRAGTLVYSAMDRAYGVESWEHLAQIMEALPPHSVKRFEWWAHGYIGTAHCAKVPLNDYGSHWVERIGKAMHPDGLFFLRTCASFCAAPGRDFASWLLSTLGCGAVAGFTRDIGRSANSWAFWDWGIQSGIQVVKKGESPSWHDKEGLDEHGRPMWSSRSIPGTIWCLDIGPTIGALKESA